MSDHNFFVLKILDFGPKCSIFGRIISNKKNVFQKAKN